jgi:predicted acyl esterase
LLGDFTATLTTSASSPHHDLFICLCDVGPDGVAINITDGYIRLSPASGDPGRRTTVIEASPTAWRLGPGHHLRLLVAAGAFPRYARNLGLGEPLARATRSSKVDISVHCGAGASFISI